MIKNPEEIKKTLKSVKTFSKYLFQKDDKG
jgi:hypothetical protein